MMRVKRIISGAQTGADRAALDFAMEYEIPCGGWVPTGRQAEDGTIPDRYEVWEMENGGYPERTEKNVLESDGTLILSHGELTGGSLLTWELTEKIAKPCLHIDFNRSLAFDAAIDVNDWMSEHSVEVLNIAGPRASKDREIYQAVFKLLETVFYVSIISDAMPEVSSRSYDVDGGGEAAPSVPVTVVAALDILMRETPAKLKARIASMPDSELSDAGISLGRWIRSQFGLGVDNQSLLEACREVSGKPNLDGDGAAMLLVREFWSRLRQMGHLRIIK